MNSSLTDTKEVRKFGVRSFVLFGTLFALSLVMKKPITAIFFGCLTLLGAGIFAMPSQMMGVHKTWLKTAHIIGKAITMIVLTLGFYLVITPAAIIKRMFGGRPLPLEPDRNVSS